MPELTHNCDVCQDLEPQEQRSHSLLQVQCSAEEGCQGCAVISAALAPYWSAYALNDKHRWAFSDMKRTLSIEIFSPAEAYTARFAISRPMSVVFAPLTAYDPSFKLFTSYSELHSLRVFGTISSLLYTLALKFNRSWFASVMNRVFGAKLFPQGPQERVSEQPSYTSTLLGSLWAEHKHITGIELWTLTEPACPWRLLSSTRAVSGDTGSEMALERLRDWIVSCNIQHAACNRFPRVPRLPTRVLEIIGPQQVRLRETNGEEGQYICLSYCWGRYPFIRTLRSNYEHNLNSIPWTDLPTTFQHAVGLARALGIRYLWIDALCILQDAQEDWAREAPLMCDTYSNCYLTIAATMSSNPTQGCFATVGVRSGATHYFDNAAGERYAVHVREPLPHINDFESADKEAECFPLLDRAWVFQERNLSPRVVHFGPNELLWECMEERTCECTAWPKASESEGTQRMFFDKPYMMVDAIPDGFIGTALTSPEEWKWRRVIEQYTAKRMTFQGDIFPALSGIATFMQRPGSDYHAGLWNDGSLLSDLLWHVRERSPEHDVQPREQDPEMLLGLRPNQWRAPTWSWASVCKPVAFTIQFDAPVRTLASVISIQTVSVSYDPFGQVKSGRLQLRGHCVDAVIVPNEHKPMFPSLTVGQKIRFGAPRLHWNAGTVDGFYTDYDTRRLYGRTVLVMEMLRWREGRSRTACSTCLVFCCMDEDKETYERIGYVDTRKSTDMAYFAERGVEKTLCVI